MLKYNQINIIYQDDNNTIYNGSDDLMELFIVNYNGVITLHNQGRDTFDEVWVKVLRDALYNEDEDCYLSFETIKDYFIDESFYKGIAYHWNNFYNDFINQ